MKVIRLIVLSSILICVLIHGVHASYEPPSDKVLIFVDSTGGVRSPLFELARMPQFCLYTSGELVYSYFDEKHEAVLAKKVQIDEKERDFLLRYFQDKGLDEWSEYYEDSPVRDMPVTRIWVKSGKGLKKINITGIDYAIRNKTIPQGLMDAYRKINYYSNDNAEDYESPSLIVYAKKLGEVPRGAGVHIFKWGPKMDLAVFASESNLSGYGSTLLEGKNAKKALRELEGKAPYSRPTLMAYFKQGGSVFSLGYRFLLPHELDKDKEGKKDRE